MKNIIEGSNFLGCEDVQDVCLKAIAVMVHTERDKRSMDEWKKKWNVPELTEEQEEQLKEQYKDVLEESK